MPRIRVNPEEIHAAGGRLVKSGMRLAQIERELRSVLSQTGVNVWRGESRRRFEELSGQVSPRSSGLARDLQRLGEKLVNAAAKFEESDSIALGRLKKLMWVDWDVEGLTNARQEPVLPPPVDRLWIGEGNRFGEETGMNSGIRGDWRYRHPGIDYQRPGGDDLVHSVAPAEVVHSGDQSSYGNTVIVRYPPDLVPPAVRALPEYDEGDCLYVMHAHLDKDVDRPPTGSTLAPGDVIGRVGSTGNSTGPHLHLEVRLGKPDLQNVNPNRGVWYQAEHLPPIDPSLVFGETDE